MVYDCKQERGIQAGFHTRFKLGEGGGGGGGGGGGNRESCKKKPDDNTST